MKDLKDLVRPNVWNMKTDHASDPGTAGPAAP